MLFLRNKSFFEHFALFINLILYLLSGELGAQSGALIDRRSQEPSSKPYARYWWFASMIQKDDVRYTLNWLKAHGFGGVELAWVYPLNRFNPNDTTYTPRQE